MFDSICVHTLALITVSGMAISNQNGDVHANYFSGLPSTQKKSPGCLAKTRVAVAGPMDSVVRSCPSWELRQHGGGWGGVSASHPSSEPPQLAEEASCGELRRYQEATFRQALRALMKRTIRISTLAPLTVCMLRWTRPF